MFSAKMHRGPTAIQISDARAVDGLPAELAIGQGYINGNSESAIFGCTTS